MKVFIVKILHILSLKEKKQALFLFFMMVIGMLLEMMSVTMLVPVISVLVQDEGVAEPLKILLTKFGFAFTENNNLFIILSMTMLVFIYLIKNIFLGILVWMQNKFVFDIQSKHTRKLFEVYLRQPYAFHLKRNSAELIRNVQVEVGLFASNIIKPILQIGAESLVFIGLCILMLSMEFFGTLIIVSVMSLSAFIYQKLIKNFLVTLGERRQFHDGLRFKHINQGLGGIKDVLLNGRQEDFTEQYAEHTKKSVKVYELQNTLMQIPRLWFELLAIISLTLLVCALVYSGASTSEVFPILGLFAAAAFRIMPSISRISSSIQLLSYSSPALDILEKELTVTNAVKDRCFAHEMSLREKISLLDISFSYENAERNILEKISIDIPRGSKIGIVGKTGSGKSTLVDIILGLLTPVEGEVCVDNVNINKNLRAWQDKIGYVPQTIYLTDDTIKRNVAFGIPLADIDDANISRVIEAAQLSEFIDELPEGINTIVGERGVRLSGGQLQRVGIARALYKKPEVLIFDEATSSLDTITENSLMKVVNDLSTNMTIIMIAHRLTTVEDCDMIFLIENGKIVDGGNYVDLKMTNEQFRTMNNH